MQIVGSFLAPSSPNLLDALCLIASHGARVIPTLDRNRQPDFDLCWTKSPSGRVVPTGRRGME